MHSNAAAIQPPVAADNNVIPLDSMRAGVLKARRAVEDLLAVMDDLEALNQFEPCTAPEYAELAAVAGKWGVI